MNEEVKEEVQTKKCKVCGELKSRIYVGRFPDGRNKKWRDESGKLWSGLVCGVCNVKRSHEMMKKTRNERKV